MEQVIATRQHLPGAWQKKLDALSVEDPENGLVKQFEWKYNGVTKETAEALARAGHNTCGGKGWVEYTRCKGPDGFFDKVVVCDCALRNAERLR